jgi:hypothetical protein
MDCCDYHDGQIDGLIDTLPHDLPTFFYHISRPSQNNNNTKCTRSPNSFPFAHPNKNDAPSMEGFFFKMISSSLKGTIKESYVFYAIL